MVELRTMLLVAFVKLESERISMIEMKLSEAAVSPVCSLRLTRMLLYNSVQLISTFSVFVFLINELMQLSRILRILFR